MKGYKAFIKGKPRITLSVRSLTRTDGKRLMIVFLQQKMIVFKIINKNKKELFKILESSNSSKDDFSLNWSNL